MAFTLAHPVHSELLIKKSRFIGCVEPMADRAAAQARVAALKAEHPGAAHVCWALLAGGQSAANDDGEPGGTAGRPILAAIDGQGLDRVMAVVTRHYGGIKLGAGGLVRAYGGAVAECLRRAERRAIVVSVRLRLRFGFADLGVVHHLLGQHAAQRLDERHDEQGGELTVELRADAEPAFRRALDDASRGRVAWIPEDRPQQPPPAS